MKKEKVVLLTRLDSGGGIDHVVATFGSYQAAERARDILAITERVHPATFGLSSLPFFA